MPKELTWREAIDKVLSESTTPLHYKDITDRIIAAGLRKSIGATPGATVISHITTPIKNLGAAAPYIKIAKGTYALRSRSGTTIVPEKLTPDVEESEELEEQYEIISSFGMFWRRAAVQWS